MSLPSHLDVTIVNQDRRHVLDILLKELEARIQSLTRRDAYDAYGTGESPRRLDVAKQSKAVQKAFAVLLTLDEEARQLNSRIATAKARLEKALGTAGTLDRVSQRHTNWSVYVLRETDVDFRDRIVGNRQVRKEKTAKLRDLKDRLLIAAATNESLEAFVKELRTIGS